MVSPTWIFMVDYTGQVSIRRNTGTDYMMHVLQIIWHQTQKRKKIMKNIKTTVSDNVDMHVIEAPNYLTKPIPLMEQWMSCDENGYLEGNVLFDMSELVTEDEETLLDWMSNRLVGDPLLSDISYKAIGTNADSSVIVNVRGNIENCDPSASDLEEICEKIKAAILNGGEEAIRDFIEELVYGRPEEDIEERVDEVLDGMPILELIKYFKKYVTSNVNSKPSEPYCGQLLAPERIGVSNVDIDFAVPGSTNETFSVAGLQFCPEDYMTAAGLKKLMELLDSGEFEILQIDGNGNTTSYFLISAKLYDELEADGINELEVFITDILDDVDKETPDGQYDWRGHRIFLGYL